MCAYLHTCIVYTVMCSRGKYIFFVTPLLLLLFYCIKRAPHNIYILCGFNACLKLLNLVFSNIPPALQHIHIFIITISIFSFLFARTVICFKIQFKLLREYIEFEIASRRLINIIIIE